MAENKEIPEKALVAQFIINGDKIQVEMKQKNLSPQEMIGLLEIAKKQVLDGMNKTNSGSLSSIHKEK